MNLLDHEKAQELFEKQCLAELSCYTKSLAFKHTIGLLEQQVNTNKKLQNEVDRILGKSISYPEVEG